MSDKDFFTFREYMKKEEDALTASMEDYLEMIYRLSIKSGFTRIHDLAAALNVQPPSVTKAVQKLADLAIVNYERYGIVTLSAKGVDLGKGLLKRHEMIEAFLQLLGVKERLLEETEKIEHTIGNETLKCLADFVGFLQSDPKIVQAFTIYREKMKG